MSPRPPTQSMLLVSGDRKVSVSSWFHQSGRSDSVVLGGLGRNSQQGSQTLEIVKVIVFDYHSPGMFSPAFVNSDPRTEFCRECCLQIFDCRALVIRLFRSPRPGLGCGRLGLSDRPAAFDNRLSSSYLESIVRY